MTGAASLAEHYRAHREAFELALQMGCTPREAARHLRDQARARRRLCGTAAPVALAENLDPIEQRPAEFSQWDARWMMRD
ncbi:MULTISPECIES: hypothetical protein [unclassified Novosphingobium]|uniref:hypothetical protein n=1 Tax=unclassified Novosphingobium TaxID=2644732 RepID=UPI000D2F4EC1|nr:MULTISPECIES: hypothetical protein [unclassified Novosphingobium]PTR11796.1 hypothetical protein C8K11_104155 [Novosphingobium sp. GV055]PUB04836.1 hypothetical protein C8K12_104155 [Novosphingobium sp. GV061]PUB21155.1 hypothetical protein C8K14_104155 [Novosphingobium sp. GV079]PUB42881.1 hypothetical protein C8K10_104155 [Novosphingobium sp. GV027]